MWWDVGVTCAVTVAAHLAAVHFESYACSVLVALGEARLGLLAHEAAHVHHGAQIMYDVAMGSHRQWKEKHNGGHHAHTNDVDDPDVQMVPLLRLHPAQPRYAIHRAQWWYQWLLFPFLPLLLRVQGLVYVYRTGGVVAHHARALPAFSLFILYPIAIRGWYGLTFTPSAAAFWALYTEHSSA